MYPYDGIGLLAQNYKSFGPDLSGFESIASINLIVGRNNSGKSALLDLVEFACKPGAIPTHLYHQREVSTIAMSTQIPEAAVKSVFAQGVSGGLWNGNHWQIGKQLIGTGIKIRLGEKHSMLAMEKNIESNASQNPAGAFQLLAQQIPNPFLGKLFYRLSAERDISTEGIIGTPQIDKTGRGFTSTVTQILNKFEHPTELVADHLLAALNEIFSPDARFNAIDVQQHGDGPWEIILNEEGKGRVGLTHSGSGLKTVLLVASYFLILPHLHQKPLSEFVFAFEELENNLHPALQRRLLKFVTDMAKKNRTLLFLTTHSNVLIDLFSQDKDATILHVTHSTGKSQVRPVQTYVENRGVLDDLDVRASDLLQSNGIVWVEGPSDRLYFNRWIELVSDGAFKEGVHYQCIFHGGRLLAHLSANDPNVLADDVVKILRVNRNAIVLIDSDKTEAATEINKTKKRIVAEIEAIGGLAWVTQGRAIENYLPVSAVRKAIPGATNIPSQFDDFAEFLDKKDPGAGKRFSRNKVLFAESVLPDLTKESLVDALDLTARLTEVTATLGKWNGI